MDQKVRAELLAHARLLEEFGPQLGRPSADMLEGSKHANMKELRFNAQDGVWRVAFAFDPKRKGILLVAGDKAGVSEKQIADINEYESSGAFTDLERIVLRYTDGITRDNTVDDVVFSALRERLSDRELVELTFCIGNWNGIARFIVPMGLELESSSGT